MATLLSARIEEDEGCPYSEPPSLILDIQFRDSDPGVRVSARDGGRLSFQLCCEINEWAEAPGHCYAPSADDFLVRRGLPDAAPD